MSFEEFSYDVKGFIKRVKDDVGVPSKIGVQAIRDRPLAKAFVLDNPPRIELPTTPTIERHLGVSNAEAVARSKVAAIEEICHIHFKDGHTPQVYECVRSRADKFLTAEEKKMVEGKMNRFCAESYGVACEAGAPVVSKPAGSGVEGTGSSEII